MAAYQIRIDDTSPDFLMIPLFHEKGIRDAQLRRHNPCRLFLQVLTISDITTGCGIKITKAAWNGDVTHHGLPVTTRTGTRRSAGANTGRNAGSCTRNSARASTGRMTWRTTEHHTRNNTGRFTRSFTRRHNKESTGRGTRFTAGAATGPGAR